MTNNPDNTGPFGPGAGTGADQPRDPHLSDPTDPERGRVGEGSDVFPDDQIRRAPGSDGTDLFPEDRTQRLPGADDPDVFDQNDPMVDPTRVDERGSGPMGGSLGSDSGGGSLSSGMADPDLGGSAMGDPASGGTGMGSDQGSGSGLSSSQGPGSISGGGSTSTGSGTSGGYGSNTSTGGAGSQSGLGGTSMGSDLPGGLGGTDLDGTGSGQGSTGADGIGSSSGDMPGKPTGAPASTGGTGGFGGDSSQGTGLGEELGGTGDRDIHGGSSILDESGTDGGRMSRGDLADGGGGEQPGSSSERQGTTGPAQPGDPIRQGDQPGMPDVTGGRPEPS